MLAHNVLARYPNVKVVVPHGGSFLPLALPRIKQWYPPAKKAKGMMGGIDFEANLSRLYYDLAGASSAAAIRGLLAITSPDHILYGSDYPYQPADVLENNYGIWKRSWQKTKTLSGYKEMFLWQNAARLFSLPSAEEGLATSAMAGKPVRTADTCWYAFQK